MGKLIIGGKDVSIDEGCINMVSWFNDNGLETRFCCDGHREDVFYIQFSDDVSDKDMEDFLMKYRNKYNHSMFLGRFSKWCRVMSDKIKYNWRYEACSIEVANKDYQRLINYNIYKKEVLDRIKI